MFCLSCGIEIPDDTRFCPSCGAPVGDNAAATRAGKTAYAPSLGAGQAAGTAFSATGPAVNSSSPDSYGWGRRRQAPGWAVAVAATFALLACGGTVAAFVLLGGFSPVGEEPENQVQVVAEQPGASEPAPVEEAESEDEPEVKSGSSPVADLEPNQDAESDAESSGTSSAGPETSTTSATGAEPFWGVWIGAFNQRQNAQERADLARGLGFSDVRIELSSDWTGLNQKGYYVVSVGSYSSKAEAERVLSSARQHFSDAYVKYSGTRK